MRAKQILAMAVAGALVAACTGGETTGSSSSTMSQSSLAVATSSEANSSVESSSPTVQSSVAMSSSEGQSSSSAAQSSSLASGSISQFVDLPDEFRISEDGERLEQGGFFTSKLYNDSVLETIYLDFPQNDYWQQLTNNYSSKTEIPATLRYKDKTLEQVGVRFRGNTSYSRAGEKKSFSIDLEYAIDGQDINGYNELKLNNAYEDPSNLREVVYANLARKNIPSARGNFVHLVVNGRDFGVYANIQKLEKDHVKEWFFDKDATRWRAEAPSGGGGFGGGFGAGTSTLNDLGANGSAYQNAYTLKSADIDDPWQDLANAAHALGVATDEFLIEQVSQYLDIDAALWFIATENIFTDDDGYVNKGGMDYYVYFDVFTGRIVPIEYDGNSAMSSRLATSWNPLYKINDANFPLMNRLLNIPELRQRYLAHYRTLISEAIAPAVAHPMVDAYANLITSAVNAAEVREYSNSEFQSGVSGLKSFFTTRFNYLNSHSDLAGTPVDFVSVVDSVNGVNSIRPTENQAVDINAQVMENIQQAYLYFGAGLAGSFTRLPMTINGNQLSAQIPAMAKGEFVRYYIEAIANDGTASYSPAGAEHDVYIYQVQAAEQVASAIVINELVADNATLVATNEGKYSDWIELYNTSEQAVDVSGWYLSDEDSQLDRWALPQGSLIPAGGTLVVWADDEADTLGGLHASFKLSASGEYVYLVTPELKIADSVEFVDAPEDQSYARSPNGVGNFIWTTDVSFDAKNP